MLQSFRLFGAALLGTLLLAVPTWAQTNSDLPVRADGASMVLTSQGYNVVMPLPDWLDAGTITDGAIAPLVEGTYAQGVGQSALDLHPKGETAETWTTRYGAKLLLTTTGTMDDFRRLTMARYAKNCQPSTTGFFQLGPDQGDTLAPLGFVCGAFFDGLVGYGGTGEIAVMQLLATDGGYAVIYQEWRGPAFDPANPGSWPVATDVVQARAFQLHGAGRLSLAD